MHINVGPKNLLLLLEPRSTAKIPIFQRSYSWEKPEVTQFLTDVYDCAESEEPHFWGPVVILRRDPKATDFEIIDGQQRVTTGVIMLSILRDKAIDLTEPYLRGAHDPRYRQDVPLIVRTYLLQEPEFTKPRLEGSYLIRSILESRVIADPTTTDDKGALTERLPIRPKGGGLSDAERRNTRQLRSAYLQIKKSLTEKLDAIAADSDKTAFVYSIYKALSEWFEIFVMELSSEDDAYALFESLNDRGRRLNPSDLLKTLTLDGVRQSSAAIQIDQAVERWDAAVDLLGEFDTTKFLRHYLLTQTSKKVQNHKIFSEFKAQISRLGPQGAYANLVKLEAAAVLYNQLLSLSPHESKTITMSLSRMNIYSQTHRVFLLGALDLNLERSAEELLTRAVEYLSFRWISTGRNAQVLETIYQQQLHLLKESPSAERVEAIANDLIKAAPSDDEFETFTTGESVALQRYLLLRIATCGGGEVPMTADVEHLAPKSPKDQNHWHTAVAPNSSTDPEVLVYEDYVYNWGNLTLLETRLNKSIRNETWQKKRDGVGKTKGISASTYNLNQVFKSTASWTAAHIESRETWLKSAGLKLISRDWVKTGHAAVSMWV
jgi:hypothetical protein